MLSAMLHLPRKALSSLLAGLVTASLVGVCALVAYDVTLQRGSQYSGPASSSSQPFASGLQTVIYKHDELALRASVGSVQLVRPRVLGPLRLGFLRSLQARNVRVERYSRGLSNDSEGVTDMAHALSRLVRLDPRASLVSADIHGLRFIEHDTDGATQMIMAQRCRVDIRQRLLACHKGLLDRGGKRQHFATAQYDGKAWRVDGTPPV